MDRDVPVAAENGTQGPPDRRLPHLLLPRRPVEKFVADPSSGRKAVAAIVSVTCLTVLMAGFAFWLFDPKEYPDLFAGIWLAIQTVTTVGYGDVAPVDPNGRFTAAITMLLGAAIISVITALITSAFVEARQVLRSGRKDRDDAAHRDILEASLAELHVRLDRIERRLETGPGATRTPPPAP